MKISKSQQPAYIMIIQSDGKSFDTNRAWATQIYENIFRNNESIV